MAPRQLAHWFSLGLKIRARLTTLFSFLWVQYFLTLILLHLVGFPMFPNVKKGFASISEQNIKALSHKTINDVDKSPAQFARCVLHGLFET